MESRSSDESGINQTNIIYLIGRMGTGKLTIAKEIAKFGYKIVDNHLVNNPVFSLLAGTTYIPNYAWRAIESIRNGILEFIVHESLNNYILTNALNETEYDRKIYNQVLEVALKRGSHFFPVILDITFEENLRRIQMEDRRTHYKILQITEAEYTKPLLTISHPNTLRIDVTALSAAEVAQQIIEHVHKRGLNK